MNEQQRMCLIEMYNVSTQIKQLEEAGFIDEAQWLYVERFEPLEARMLALESNIKYPHHVVHNVQQVLEDIDNEIFD